MKTLSFRVKLILCGILAALTPLLIVGIISVSKSSEALTKIAENRAMVVSQELSSKIDLILKDKLSIVKEISEEPFIVDTCEKIDDRIITISSIDLAGMDEHIKRICSDVGINGDMFYLADSNGKVVSDSDGGKRRKNKMVVSDRSYFLNAKKGKTSISEPVIARSTGKPAFIIASPIYSGSKKFIGIFANVVELDAFSDIISSTKIGKTGYPFITDRKGIVLAHINKALNLKLTMQQKEMKGIANLIMERKSGIVKYVFQGKNKIASVYPMHQKKWSVCFTQEESEFLGPVKSIRNIFILTAFISLILTILGFLFFVRRVMNLLGGEPVKIASVADTIAQGDLTYEFNNNGKELTGVYASMKRMRDNLAEMLEHITEGTATLTSSSTELSAISDQMKSNSEQTSGLSENVSVSAEEMSTSMTSVAAASEQTTANLHIIVTAAEEMSATINEISANTTKGMNTTADAVKKAEDIALKVRELGDAALEISKVTETISDISEQTNLLALNATIEAARAGESGKGFTVVANEIKALAHQTAQATNEIGLKINNIQNTTTQSVGAIQSIVGVIDEINAIVTTVATAIEEQTSTTLEITNNVTQAATGVREVNENVNQTSVVAGNVASDINKVNISTEEIRSGSSQVSSSASELSELAEKLNILVNQFRLH